MFRILYILFLILLPVKVGAQQQEQHRPYSKERLQQAIYRYEAIARAGSWHTFPPTVFIRPGDSSRYVLPLQENLLLTGDLPLDAVTDESVCTPSVTTAVQNFQRRHGLVTDGVVGPNTIAALNVHPAQRLEQLRLNLGRFDSAFAYAQEPYAVINLPDYSMQVVDSGKTVLDMPVIIGKPELKTFPVYSELDMVVLYPYWYVPRSIAVKEIVPILRRNPGYLSKKNMRLEKPTIAGWVRVNPWVIDWQHINNANFDYRIVQLHGPDNELGTVKFPFTNRLPQYLHDTPGKELFNYPNRAFSHGCIRIEKPVELANYLLARGSGYSERKIQRLWDRNKPNHYIRIKEPVPLFIVYLTAWVDERRQVQFRKDMYGYDARLGLTLREKVQEPGSPE